jgi:hypothetical protein
MNGSIGVCMHKKASTEVEISKNSIHQQHFEMRVSTHFWKREAQVQSGKQLLKKKNLSETHREGFTDLGSKLSNQLKGDTGAYLQT